MGATPRGPMRFETAAIHAGQDPEGLYGSVNVPIYQTSTYAQDGVGKPKLWDYARGGNPTREAFQQALAALEGGERCLAFGSGLGAESTLLLSLAPGITCSSATTCTAARSGCWTRSSRAGAWSTTRATWPTSTRCVAAPPGDPLRLGRVAVEPAPEILTSRRCERRPRSRCAGRVDNTFATPALQRPIELGADPVVHSVTKYLGGHSDLIGGAIVANDPEWVDASSSWQRDGRRPGPDGLYLGSED